MHKIRQILMLLFIFLLIFCLCSCMQDQNLAYPSSYIQFWFTDTPSTLTQPGEKFQIKYNLQPVDAEIRWNSDNNDVAVIDEYGVVTAVGPGTCNITATVGDVTENGQVWDSYTECSTAVTCDFD